MVSCGIAYGTTVVSVHLHALVGHISMADAPILIATPISVGKMRLLGK